MPLPSTSSRAAVARLRALRSICTALVVAALAACGSDSPAEPEVVRNGVPGIRFVSGNAQTDTIGAQLAQLLVIEVRRADRTIPIGVPVVVTGGNLDGSFDASVGGLCVSAIGDRACEPSQPARRAVFALLDTTGRVRVEVTFRDRAGPAVVRVQVPDLNLVDSTVLVIQPGNAVRVRAAVADTVIEVGDTLAFRPGRVLDRADNVRRDSTVQELLPGPSVGSHGPASAIGQRFGVQQMVTRFAALSDTTRITVVPAGRIVTYSAGSQDVLLVNSRGTRPGVRLGDRIFSQTGVSPRVSESRQRVTFLYTTRTASGLSPSPDAIAVTDTSGSARRDITGVFSFVVAARALADGSVLAVGRRAGEALTAPLSLWRIASDDAVTRLHVLTGAVESIGPAEGLADIARDGSRVVYIVVDPVTFQHRLHVLSVATGAVVVIDANARSPRFSPTADRILFVNAATRGGMDRNGQPTVINVDGSARRQVSSLTLGLGLVWTPDGEVLIGREARPGGPGDTFMIRLADGFAYRLAEGRFAVMASTQGDWF